MVADFVINNVWTWPQAWIAKAPILNLIPAPNLDENTIDCVRWRDVNGVFSDFSVSRAWEAFRPRGNEVNWFRIVWFPHSIPRHSFHLWLVMRNSLKTQDKLRQWDCPYSSKVWKLVRHLADMELVAYGFFMILPILRTLKRKDADKGVEAIKVRSFEKNQLFQVSKKLEPKGKIFPEESIVPGQQETRTGR
ncbi:reverse transcriptase domain-containing protein [Tanacetum coccineum]